MDERVRRRKSGWEAEDGSLLNSRSGKDYHSSYDAEHSHKYLSSKTDSNLLTPKDQAYSRERMYRGGLDEPEMRDQGLNKNYYKNISPGYDERGRRKHSDSGDDGWIHSRRSRSRSRSRDRGRSRSCSPSWGRGRGRGRDRGSIRSQSRSRSRSRSKNRSKNPVRGPTRSRSPFHDRRREPHGWNDKIGSGQSSSICRNFASGYCRRGSQCMFLHTGITDGVSEDDLKDRWKDRPERGRAMRHGEEPESQSWDKVDSSYADDNSRTRSRGVNPCKNYASGKCQRGASCKFSHHDGSGDNIVKGVGNASFGHDRQPQGGDKSKPLCKYFLAGKCNRENCWFSHDHPAAGNQEKRPHEEGGRHISPIKSGAWNGPSWDEIQTDSHTAEGTGWGDRIDANEGIVPPSESMKNKWAPEGSTWRSPEWKEKASKNSSFISTHEFNEDKNRSLGTVARNSNDRQEHSPISPGLKSAKFDDISSGSHSGNLIVEDSSHHLLLANLRTSDVSMKSDTQQSDMAVNNNLQQTFSYSGFGAVNETSGTMKSEFMPRQIPSQNGIGNLDFHQSSVSNDVRDNFLFSHPSNLQSFDLNGSGQVLSSSLNMQNHHENHEKETARTQEMQELGARQSFFSSIPNGQVAQYFSTPTAAPSMQKFINEQAHPSFNPLISTQIVSGLQSAMPMQQNPLGERGENTDQKSSFPYEQRNQIPFEQFSPMSGDVIEPEGNLPGSSTAQFLDTAQSKNPELLQQQLHISAVSEPKEQGKPAFSEQEQRAPALSEGTQKVNDSSEEKMKGKENVPKENGEARGKVENGSANKEDKDLRLFKNALVESVKELLKPTWKLGKMSRDVHKTIVKKVVDKVTSTIQADHIPKTQDKIDQYLSHAKTKISKLVQAYVDRHLKTDS